MCKGLFINVGWAIHDEMVTATYLMKSNQAIGFPSLITTLFKKANLRALTDPTEQVLLMSDLI